jgi:hypothetical protein
MYEVMTLTGKLIEHKFDSLSAAHEQCMIHHANGIDYMLSRDMGNGYWEILPA